ncbi:MAG: cell division protein FtsA, partial [Bacteroidales bacterium]
IISLGFVDAEAERFKITLGSAILSSGEQLKGITLEGQGKNSIKPKDLNRTAVARMEEIAVNVVNQIKESGYKTQLKGGIIITGNASLLKDLPELLHKESGMDVRCGNISENVITDKNLNIQLSQYAQTIGIIMYGGEICITREREKDKSGFWPFANDKKPQKSQKPQNERHTAVQAKQEQPKTEKREERKGPGIFDKIKSQIVDMMGEDENEDINKTNNKNRP